MEKIAFFCGSRFDYQKRYVNQIKQGVTEIARKYDVIFGGSNTGYMKLVADSVKEANGKLIGIMPKFLKEKELAYENLDELIEVADMNTRKQALFDLADGFIALPGGLGTFEEVIDLLSWLQLGLYQKPVGFYNPNHFFDHLIQLIEEKIAEGFIEPSFKNLYFVSDNLMELVRMMEASDLANQEAWDLYDRNRKPLASTILRRNMHLMKEGQYHLVVFLILKNHNQYLLQQRSVNKETYPQLWDLSVGGSALAFEDSLQAITRETFEELGLSFNPSEFNCVFKFVDDENKALIDVYQIEVEPQLINQMKIPNLEVSQVKWFKKEEINQLSEKGLFIDTVWKKQLLK